MGQLGHFFLNIMCAFCHLVVLMLLEWLGGKHISTSDRLKKISSKRERDKILHDSYLPHDCGQ